MSNKDDEEYFGNLKLMFQSEGWKLLIRDLQDNAAYINSVENTSDVNDLFFRKGQLAVLANLLNLEDVIQRAEADANESSQ
jgi:hypothetical protein